MKQIRLLTLLVLLAAVVSGAWATPNSIVINGTTQVGDKSISLTYNFDPANVTGYNYGYLPTLKVKCAADNKWDEVNLPNEASSGTKTISLSNLGEFEAGKTYEVCFAYNNGGWVDDVFQTFVPAPAGYTVSMKDGVKDADKWTVKVGEGQAQALPIGGLKGDGSETVTLQYNGRLKVKGVKATSDAAPAAPAGNIVDLSTLTADYVAKDGDVLTNATTTHKVEIAAGATVTLDGATISRDSYCIKCAGSATIILKDGTTNTLTSTSTYYPALWAGDTNTTLTIQGNTGVLDVTSGSNCAGIGGGYSNTDHTCGNIRIEGGFITARGGAEAAGIGTEYGPATCGDIIITGGTINATGGQDATGIGAGRGAPGKPSNCGAITITNGVTKVTATKGVCTDLIDCIGAGYNNSSSGTVTIGGTVYWENNAYANGGDTYLTTSPLIYPQSE